MLPERVSVPTPVFVRLPPEPVIAPELVPAVTVSAVVPRATAPPLRVVTDAVAPLRLAVPEVSVVIVATPPTVRVPPLRVVTVAPLVTVVAPPVTDVELSEPAETVPPEIVEDSRPAAETVPTLRPPVMVAADEKVVVPAPASEARVIVPVAPEKAVVPALVTPARERPVPEIVAEPVASTASVAVAL